MSSKNPSKKKAKDTTESKKKREEHLRAINHVATRLPWIAVIVTLLSMILIFIEVALRSSSGK